MPPVKFICVGLGRKAQKHLSPVHIETGLACSFRPWTEPGLNSGLNDKLSQNGPIHAGDLAHPDIFSIKIFMNMKMDCVSF